MAVDHVIPFFSFIAMLAVLVPAGPHVRARNSGTLLLIGWIFISNLIIFVNGLAWWSSTDNRAPIWCDISTKLTLAISMGIPCANLCIAIRLESIASTRVVSLTASQRRRRLYQDLAIGLALPLIFTITSIVSQGHRFDIAEGVGCVPATYISAPWIGLVLVPQLVVSFVSLTFSMLALRQFWMHQKQFSSILQASGSSMTTSRYTRLMLLTITELLVTLPIVMVVNIRQLLLFPLQPWTSWPDVHANFNTVLEFPASFFDSPETRKIFIIQVVTRWTSVLCAIIFFAFFGLSVEARQQYARCFNLAASPFRSCRSTKVDSSRMHDLGKIEASSYGTKDELLSAKSGSFSGSLPYEPVHQASFMSEAPSSPGICMSPRVEVSVQRHFD